MLTTLHPSSVSTMKNSRPRSINSKLMSAPLVAMLFQIMVLHAMARNLQGVEDQKTYYPPDPHHSTPSVPTTPSHGSPTPSGSGGSGNCGTPPTHHGGGHHGGRGYYHSPPTTPTTPTINPPTVPVTPTPSFSPPVVIDPGTPPYTPSTPSTPPTHHGGGGYYHSPPTTPTTPTINPPTIPVTPTPSLSPPVVIDPGTPPYTPSTPSTPPPTHNGGGGYYHSPPTTPTTPTIIPPTVPVTPTPSLSPPAVIDPGTPPYTPSTPSTPPLLPSPTTPPYIDPNTIPPIITGTCNFWTTHPNLIWGIFGYWGTVGPVFGLTTTPAFTPGLSLLQALSNTRTDGYGALYREGTASLLNSLATRNFSYTTQQVKDRFSASLVSDNAAAAQARLFKRANEGKLKLIKP